MNPVFLFSGSDISGRDSLLTRSVGRTIDGVIARTVTALSLTLATVGMSGASPIRNASITAPVPIEVAQDTLLERVWKVRSDGIQPNDKARRRATTVLQALRDVGLEPQRIVADPDGGVAVYVFGGPKLSGGATARHARVLAANEGELIAFCVDNESSSQDGWELELGDLEPAMNKIQSFVVG